MDAQDKAFVLTLPEIWPSRHLNFLMSGLLADGCLVLPLNE